MRCQVSGVRFRVSAVTVYMFISQCTHRILSCYTKKGNKLMTIVPFVSIGPAAPTVPTHATASAASRARDTPTVAVLFLVPEKKDGAQRSSNNTGRAERGLFTQRYECGVRRRMQLRFYPVSLHCNPSCTRDHHSCRHAKGRTWLAPRCLRCPPRFHRQLRCPGLAACPRVRAVHRIQRARASAGLSHE